MAKGRPRAKQGLIKALSEYRHQASLYQQVKSLLYRNFLLKKRIKKQTSQEIFFPIYFVLLLAVIRYFLKPQQLPAIPAFPSYSLDKEAFQPNDSRLLYVSPDSDAVKQIMGHVVEQLNISGIRYFENSSDIAGAYRENTSIVAAGIVFTGSEASEYSYTIRLPYENITSTDPKNIYITQDLCRIIEGQDVLCPAQKYLYSGFAAIQRAIDTAILRIVSGSSDFPAPEVEVEAMAKSSFVSDTRNIQVLSSVYFVLAYAPYVNFLTVNLVAEKERKIKEAMRMMGMRDASFWLSWSLVYLVIILIVTFAVTLIAWIFNFLLCSNMFLFFLMQFLYGLSVITLCFMVSSFFNKAEVAGALASVASMIFSLVALPVIVTRMPGPTGPVSAVPVWGQYLLCLFSPVALALSVDQAVYMDIAEGGVHFDNLGVGQFPLSASMSMLALDFVLYGLLAVYLDNVVPSEYGQTRPPWFFLQPSYWCRRPRTELDVEQLTLVAQGSSVDPEAQVEYDAAEAVSADLTSRNMVRIFNVHKKYKSEGKLVHAVNGFTLDIYEGQITALLGHNGAGKTTLMNILVGMTTATSGAATIYGMNVLDPNDMNFIRTLTGVCPQHNILIDELTCWEHLEVFANLKGIAQEEIKKEIEQALMDVDLFDQKSTMANYLSGGQKRKLSVAIALIGDPKLIFLDEPTAGMDPSSRRHLWSLLKERSKDRVILLTTHFMDEADILADRKAFMSKGRLRCVGSSLFLKNRFGVGYHLG